MAQDTLKTLTVRELIDVLQDENPDALVIFSVDYGDYHHTQQALPIRGECEETLVEKSAYSHSGFALSRDDADQDDGPDAAQAYLVIR